jgi:hypothetical protein
MRRIIISSSAAIVVALAVLTGSAAASGPAAPGKQIVQLTCGSDTYTISIQRGENSGGAAQIVGRNGHFIGVSFDFTLLDVTTNTVLDTESSAVGGGHAHPNQATRSCSVVFFEGTATDFFGPEPLPPGVAPTDIIRADVVVGAIPKL